MSCLHIVLHVSVNAPKHVIRPQLDVTSSKVSLNCGLNCHNVLYSVVLTAVMLCSEFGAVQQRTVARRTQLFTRSVKVESNSKPLVEIFDRSLLVYGHSPGGDTKHRY